MLGLWTNVGILQWVCEHAGHKKERSISDVWKGPKDVDTWPFELFVF
jgi:hypothetical protein